MFGVFLLPLLITTGIFAFLIFVLCLLASALKWHYINVVWFASVFIVILFVPTCAGVQMLVDDARFGRVVYYEKVEQIRDKRIAENLPKMAKHIEVVDEPSHFYATYQLSPQAFGAYLDNMWQNRQSVFKRDEVSITDNLFVTLGWDLPDNVHVYRSRIDTNGAGITLYRDEHVQKVWHIMTFW